MARIVRFRVNGIARKPLIRRRKYRVKYYGVINNPGLDNIKVKVYEEPVLVAKR
jgi:hypothetical protein